MFEDSILFPLSPLTRILRKCGSNARKKVGPTRSKSASVKQTCSVGKRAPKLSNLAGTHVKYFTTTLCFHPFHLASSSWVSRAAEVRKLFFINWALAHLLAPLRDFEASLKIGTACHSVRSDAPTLSLSPLKLHLGNTLWRA